MGFLVGRWRRIGTRLYLALGFAVLLTLGSSAVGVYYFEQSGDLNYRVRTESVPVLEATWTAAREAEQLRILGLGLLAAPESGFAGLQPGSVAESLGRLASALGAVSGAQALASDARAVNDAAHDLAVVIDNLTVNRTALSDTYATAADLRTRLAGLSPDDEASVAALSVLKQALQAADEAVLEQLWDEYAKLHAAGVDPAVAALAGDQGVFTVRGQQLALWASVADLTAAFDEASVALKGSVSDLLAASRAQSEAALGQAGSSFDQGRLLLTVISVISVVAATLAAWLWVGNGMVRRLSRLSERMRRMADGDLETPVPEAGRDEIGELVDALEVFRQQALEVQRLNLVEKLYGELRVANAELQRMQARLVAQEKLAALGESYEPVLTVSSRVVDDNVVEVRVRDNGPGIADDVVGRIFDPFFSTREGAMGAGLGLPIAADVARRLGGDLSVDTAYGEYAEFTLSLPAGTATALETEAVG